MLRLSSNKIIRVVFLMSLAVGGAQAQQRPGDSERFSQSLQDAQSVRNDLRSLLQMWYPPTVLDVLQLDPLLMSNERYMAAYPRLAEFVAAHPEVLHNPAFFLGRPDQPTVVRSPNIVGPLLALLAVAGAAAVLIWITRAVIDHRRWLRVSKLQNEAQAKLLERFSSNEELLNFIQTPAGKRFLEYSVMPPEPRSITAPIGRILWSVQAGLVLLAGGFPLHFLITSSVAETEIRALGLVLMAIGIGFICSGIAAYILTRRFGLLDRPDTVS